MPSMSFPDQSSSGASASVSEWSTRRSSQSTHVTAVGETTTARATRQS